MACFLAATQAQAHSLCDCGHGVAGERGGSLRACPFLDLLSSSFEGDGIAHAHGGQRLSKRAGGHCAWDVASHAPGVVGGTVVPAGL